MARKDTNTTEGALCKALDMLSIDNVGTVSERMKHLKIDESKKTLIGPDYKSDDDYYVVTCSGVDEDKNVYVKLRVKRKRV